MPTETPRPEPEQPAAGSTPPAPSPVAPPPNAWTWVAFYDDGSQLLETGDPAGDHAFSEIDLARCTGFQLEPVDPDSGRSSFMVLIDPKKGQRPIFFRRRATPWEIAGGEPETLMTCIGRQEKAGRRNFSTYVFFDDAGHVLIADNANPLD